MQRKTIIRVLTKKLESWLETITDEKLRKRVKDNLLVSGGSITSMLLHEKVNDFDIHIQDMSVLVDLAGYYLPDQVLDGRKRQQILINHYKDKFNCSTKHAEEYIANGMEEDLSQTSIFLKNLKPNQVKLNVHASGYKVDHKEEIPENSYKLKFASPNALSLSDDIQIVTRFSGSPEEIHKTFDFMHATNYFTFKDGLVTNIIALESILSKDLKYQGSLYPLTSIIRIKKFLKRGWTINAGEMLKIMFQISELNLSDVQVLEDQLIGVDIAYFDKLIDIIREMPSEKIKSGYLNVIIDRVFNQYDESDE